MRIDALSGGSSLLWVMKPQKVMRSQRMIADPLAITDKPSLTTQAARNNRIIQPEIDLDGRLIMGSYESSIGNFVDIYS